ncbi:MAG: hypothetical protein A2X08_17995 [Bacteroidetes bacterium GWA2_32_17]|nr:MAG: hypothetical protein A2X08_17995 [Bacteroidetes bacterium GWA2_32_17]
MKKYILIIASLLITCLVHAQEVKINSNRSIESGGALKIESSATEWQDLKVNLESSFNSAAVELTSGTSGPHERFIKNNEDVESLSFIVQLPFDWKEGTTIYPKLNWKSETSATGNVVWNFEYTWANLNTISPPESYPAITINTIVAKGPLKAKRSISTNLTNGNIGIDGAGKKISSYIICRISRNSNNANDTYNADVCVMSFSFQIEKNVFESQTLTSK